MMANDYDLFTPDTVSIVYGMQTAAVQRMLDFDAICKRERPSVACMVNPGRTTTHKAFFGEKEILIPVYPDVATACAAHPDVDVMVNFASFRSAYAATKEAFEQDQLRTVVIIAEGVPERRIRELTAEAREKGKVIIGPATVGGLVAGAFKIGNTAGTIDNIVASKLHRPGCVGFVSKSGGMSNEMYNIIARNTNGLYEGEAIGGDTYPGSTLLEHLLRYEKNPAIKMLVCLGEVGGIDEYDILDAVKDGRIKKPLVMWVTGTCAKVFPTSVQFGHAGAKADSAAETADAKNEALVAAGVVVPASFDDFDAKIKEVYEDLVRKGEVKEVPEEEPPPPPMDYAQALKLGKVRKPTTFISTIADDRGEELTYNHVLISDVVKDQRGIGMVLGHLWFKKDLPPWATQFIEIVLKLTADHGPCVSGAHNAIVASRAGKDLISSLVSGLLTIGPRFGGAIDGAARHFTDAFDRGLGPYEFVSDMKSKNIRIPGIGHRIKSVQNPDMRVTLLQEFAHKNFPKTELLDFALEVEKVTTAKKNNLILNVDGCIGILFVDMMRSLPELFSEEEVKEVIQLGYLNGLFVLGRSIGLIGHVMDQKRLKAGLYRHPWDDVLYQ